MQENILKAASNHVNSTKVPEIWVLVDERAGHNAQSIGVAERLNLPYRLKKLVFKKNSSLPNFLKFNALKTIDRKESDIIDAPWPDIIITCGRRSAPIALEIKKLAKKKAGKKCYVANIMWPGIIARNFDLIAVPEHDSIPLLFSRSKKIIRTVGAPNKITKDFLLQEYKIWNRTIGELPTPRIGVLLGGGTKKTEMNIEQAKELTELAIKLVSALKASILISTSRRTPDDVAKYVEEEVKRRVGRYVYFHNYNESKANPFFALLQLSDMLIVTGDSISMCSEACSTGTPVFIYSPKENTPEKHRIFHESLKKSGYASSFKLESIEQAKG